MTDRKDLIRLLAVAGTAISVGTAASAQTVNTWTGGSDATFNDAGNWSGGAAVTGAIDNLLRFDNTGANFPNLSVDGANVTGLDGLLFEMTGQNIVIAPAAAQSLSFDAAATTLTFNNGTNTVTLNTNIILTGAMNTITNTGTGLVTFGGAAATDVNNNALVLDGTGNITFTNGLANVGSFTNNNTGTVTLGGAFTGDSLAGAGGFTLGANTITLNGDGNATVETFDLSGIINTAGLLTVANGEDIQILSGANTFAGGVTVGAGVLGIGSSSNSPFTAGALGTGTFTLNNGSTFFASGANRSVENTTAFTAAGTSNFGQAGNNFSLSLIGQSTFGANSVVNVNSGNLIFNPATGATTTEDVIFGDNVTIAGPATGSGIVTFLNNLVANTTIAAGDDLIFNGNTGGLTITGNGRLPLSVFNANTIVAPGQSIGTMTFGTPGTAANTAEFTLNGSAAGGDATLAIESRTSFATASGVLTSSTGAASGADADLIDIINPDGGDTVFGGAVIGQFSTVNPTFVEEQENSLRVLRGLAAADIDGDGTIETAYGTGTTASVALTGDRQTIVRTGGTGAGAGFVTIDATNNGFVDGVAATDAAMIAELQANQALANGPQIDTNTAVAGDQTFVVLGSGDFFVENVLEYGLGADTSSNATRQELQLVSFRQEASYTGASSDNDNDDIASAIWQLDNDARTLASNTGGTNNRGIVPTGNGFNEAAWIIANFDSLNGSLSTAAGDATPTSLEDFDIALKQIEDGVRGLTQGMALVTVVNEQINTQQNDYIVARMNGNDVLARSFNGADLASNADDPQLLAAAYNAQASGPDYSADPWTVYVRGFGIFEEQDADSNVTGYEADGGGVTAGVDYAFNENFLLGIYFTYNATDVDFDNGLGDLDIDTYRFGPYLGMRWGDFWVNVQATFAFHDTESNRNTFFTANSADYDSFDFTLYGALGYDFTFDQFVITPEFSIQYTHFDQDGFSESGNGGVTVSDVESDLIDIRLGATFAYVYQSGNVTWIPEVSVGWDYEADDDLDDVTGRFNAGTGSFNIQSDLGDDSAVFIGAGLTAAFDNNVSLFARYDGEFSGDRDVHAVGGGISFRF